MRILFIAVGWSPHTTRWIGQLGGRGWDLHLFPLNADEGVHPELRNVTVHDAIHGRPRNADKSVRAVDDLWPFVRNGYPFKRGAMTARRIEQKLSPTRADRAWRLANTIRKLKPDIIHSLTTWPAGDLVMQAAKFLDGQLPPWVVTSWGSDMYLFPRLAEHRPKIEAVLRACDYFTCECERELPMAREMGFAGEFLPVLPVGGGIETEGVERLRAPGLTSERRLVLLKGYQSVAGRALVGLRAIELCADQLRDYRVGVYLAAPDVAVAAELAAQTTGLNIEIITQRTHEEMLQLHGGARVSVGLSISEAISTSLLEAMTMGSFPVQSNTSCAGEFIKCGESCLFVPAEDPEAVAAAIRRAVADDDLVNRAAVINQEVIARKFAAPVVQPQAVAIYEKVFERGGVGKR